MRSKQDANIGIIILNLFGAYIFFILLMIAYIYLIVYDSFSDSTMANDNALGYGMFVFTIVYFISPLNILVLCIMFWSKINKIIIQHFWMIIIECLTYVFVFHILEENDFKCGIYCFILPYLVIVPLAAMHNYLKLKIK